MPISKKRLFSIVGLLVMLLVCGYWFYPTHEDESGYIFDKSSNITLEDAKKATAPLPIDKTKKLQSLVAEKNKNSEDNDFVKEISAENLNQLFAGIVINSYSTHKYFKHIEQMFQKRPLRPF